MEAGSEEGGVDTRGDGDGGGSDLIAGVPANIMRVKETVIGGAHQTEGKRE